ncbi:hypothetical protein [Microbulbifer sp. TYP-18]|uniref:hypothetical protein n=1 Tax=Microbulbifer sp. TYP-18 TaxID=3230024 RepID=UPI0034C6D6C4
MNDLNSRIIPPDLANVFVWRVHYNTNGEIWLVKKKEILWRIILLSSVEIGDYKNVEIVIGCFRQNCRIDTVAESGLAPRVVHEFSQTVRQTKPLAVLTQQQKTGIGYQIITSEICRDFAARKR